MATQRPWKRSYSSCSDHNALSISGCRYGSYPHWIVTGIETPHCIPQTGTIILYESNNSINNKIRRKRKDYQNIKLWHKSLKLESKEVKAASSSGAVRRSVGRSIPQAASKPLYTASEDCFGNFDKVTLKFIRQFKGRQTTNS